MNTNFNLRTKSKSNYTASKDLPSKIVCNDKAKGNFPNNEAGG